MTLSVREQILQAIFVRLQSITDVTVYRNTDTEIDEVALPAIVQIDGGHTASQENYGTTNYEMDVGFELFVTCATDAELGTAINDLYQKVMTVLLQDETLGNLSLTLRETDLGEPEISRADGVQPAAGALLTVSVSYMTKVADITSVGP